MAKWVFGKISLLGFSPANLVGDVMGKPEYKAIGIVHARTLNPWPANKEGELGNISKVLNAWAEQGWKLKNMMIAGNNDRGIYILKKD